jgi:hypothetical protein
MANDTVATIPVINGSQQSIAILATVNGSTQYAWQSTPRVNGALVDVTNPMPNKPGQVTLVALDVATVTTGGTAVTALTAGHRTAGGWIQNPLTATVNLGINEIGTATGTTSAGSTTFIAPGQTYMLAPSGNAVSVISSDSAHAFSGYGWQ